MNNQIGFRKLIRQVLPEVWVIKLIEGVFVAVSTGLIGLLANALLRTRSVAFTTSNMGELFLSWQGIVLILIGLAVVLILVTLELFSVIILFDDVMKGHQQNVFRQTFLDIRHAFAVLPRFFRPAGLLILLYLVIALPLIGVRFLMDSEILKIWIAISL